MSIGGDGINRNLCGGGRWRQLWQLVLENMANSHSGEGTL